MKTKEKLKCVCCGAIGEHKAAENGVLKKPRGWKQLGGDYCPKCWKSFFVVRAVSFPVIGPLDAKQKDAFYTALRTGCRLVSRLSNFLMTEYKTRDRACVSSDGKLPKWEIPYLYKEARAFMPELESQAVISVDSNVKATYSKCRFHVTIGKQSLPTMRDPQPYPVRSASWTARWLTPTEKVPVLSVPVCGVRFDLRLKSGPHFRPQHHDFGELVEGRALGGQLILTLHQKTKTKNSRVMAKLVMYIRRNEHSGIIKDKTMVVRSDAKSFLIGAPGTNQIWRFNANHVIRWQAEHDWRLGRLREDCKLERRTRKIPDPGQFRERIVAKHHKRMHTFLHQASAVVIDRALRMKCSRIAIDTSEHGYIESFPWFQLRVLVAQKAAANGLEFEDYSAPDDPELSEDANETESEP